LAGPGELAADRVAHDAFDAALEVRAGDTRDARDRRFEVQLAGFEDALGVSFGRVAQSEDFLVAGALALVEQAGADPPDQRMEPEDRFGSHVQRGPEIVTAADVAVLVGF